MDCVEVGVAPWRKSTRSGHGGQNCVEAVGTPGAILIRDTKDNGKGLTLRVPPSAWQDFTTRIRARRLLS
jgi:hypothetical protein